MQQDSTLKIVKYSAMVVSGLMVAGIGAVIFLARGTGEDITGVVAPALLMAMVAGGVAIVAAVLEKRGAKASDLR